MKIAIITGASRGFGLSLAEEAAASGYHLLTIARKSEINELTELVQRYDLTHTHYPTDLSDLEATIETANKINAKLAEIKEVTELLIINNAGLVNPIGPVGKLNNTEIDSHVRVNVTAPMILVNTIKQDEVQAPLTVVNITSGAAERATYGWNAYTATKAAINRYTETAALEARELNLDEMHIAFSPGIMDTDMQADIRDASVEAFKDVDQFKAYHDEGQLRSPETVARVLFELVNNRQDLDNGRVYRLYDLI